MTITRETVLHVARLARLDLSEDEVEPMKRDLSNILDYVEELSRLDTEGVPETAHVAVDAAPLRADERKPSLPTEVALSQSARSVAGAFAVPAFVEET